MTTAEKIETHDITEICASRFGSYSKYVIQDRALPDIRDGMKPVQRRIIYGMYKSGNTYDKPYRKSARSVGEIMGKYHPHGDSSIYGAMIRMSQQWVSQHPLVQVHGNNGSIDGDSPAAMRYTEARLSEYVSNVVMQSMNKKEIVDYIPNFDESEQEPTVLLTKAPQILFNGIEGIAVGYATEIPTFNLKETMTALIAVAENKDITNKELRLFLKAPDFSTGGVMTNVKETHKAMETGRGKFTVRGAYTVQKLTSKVNQIVFTSIPYGENKTKLIMALDKIVASKNVQGLLKASDESGRDGLRITVDVDSSVDINVILGYLFKNTPLQANISMNLVAIHKAKPVQLGVYDVLRHFHEFRVESVKKEVTYDKKVASARLHIVDGFIKLSSIIEEVIKTIKASSGRADAIKQLVAVHEFSTVQAESIVSMQLHRISKTDVNAYLQEKSDLEKKIAAYTKLLERETLLVKYIVSQYADIIEKYGIDRQTELVEELEDWTVRKVDVIQEEDTFVGVSRNGYIKRANRRSFNTSTKNGLLKEDEEKLVQETTTKNILLLFLSNGEYMYLPVHEIEDTKWGDTGKHIATYINSTGGAELSGVTIVSAFIIDEENEKDLARHVLTVKSNGLVKRTVLKEYVVSRYRNVYTDIKITEAEEVLVTLLEEPEKEYFIGFTTSEGRKLAYSVNDIIPKGIRTQGMRGIHLTEPTITLKDVYIGESMPKKYENYQGTRGTKGKV